MSERRFVLHPENAHPELDRLLAQDRCVGITDEQLAEQRVSFAYGNALDAARITKESVRAATKRVRLIAA